MIKWQTEFWFMSMRNALSLCQNKKKHRIFHRDYFSRSTVCLRSLGAFYIVSLNILNEFRLLGQTVICTVTFFMYNFLCLYLKKTT